MACHGRNPFWLEGCHQPKARRMSICLLEGDYFQIDPILNSDTNVFPYVSIWILDNWRWVRNADAHMEMQPLARKNHIFQTPLLHTQFYCGEVDKNRFAWRRVPKTGVLSTTMCFREGLL